MQKPNEFLKEVEGKWARGQRSVLGKLMKIHGKVLCVFKAGNVMGGGPINESKLKAA